MQRRSPGKQRRSGSKPEPTPGADPARRPSASTPRTRTGCQTCRRRSVKCDEAKPRCRKCEKMGLSCQYGLRLQWIEDSMARGICHGRQGVLLSSRRKRMLSKDPQRQGVDTAAKIQATLQIGPPLDIRYPMDSGDAKSENSLTFFLNTFVADVEACLNSESRIQGRSTVELSDQSRSNAAIVHHEHDTDEEPLNHPCVARKDIDLNEDKGTALNAFTQKFFDISWPLAWDKWNVLPSTLNAAGLASPLDHYDGHILRYYDDMVCSKAVLLDDENNNPFRYVILPMVSSSSIVLSAVLTIGASKLALNDERFRHRAMIHRNQVLNDLTSLLKDIHGDLTHYLEVLISAVILCWCDASLLIFISDHCRSTWVGHLKGIIGILDACPRQAGFHSHAMKLVQFCWQYLIYHLIMAKATFQIDKLLPNSRSALSRLLGDKITLTDPFTDPLSSQHNPVTDHSFWPLTAVTHSEVSLNENYDTYPEFDFSSLSSFRHLCQIDACQGFSNELLFLLNKICDLADSQDSSELNHVPRENDGLTQNVNAICNSLENLLQLPPRLRDSRVDCSSSPFTAGSQDSKITSERMLEVIVATAEANRLAALVFLDETCALRFPGVVPACRNKRAAYVEKMISLAERVFELEVVTAAQPIWPVFVAGCSAVKEKDRKRILNILHVYQLQKNFAVTSTACAALENVWRQYDLRCDESPGKSPSESSSTSAMVQPMQSSGKTNGKKQKADLAERPMHQAQYPWEQAIFMLKGTVLSLT